jgi:hypothetical protein
MRKIFAAGAVAVTIGAFALPAGAQETLNQFGAAGQLAIDAHGGTPLYISADPGGAGGSVGTGYGLTPFIGWTFHKASEPDNGGDHNDVKSSIFYINPGIDYFVIDHLSIGGEVLLAFTGTSVTQHRRGQPDRTADGQGGTHFGILPRVGYDILIGDKFSLWPRGGLGFIHSGYSGAGAPDNSGTAWLFYADVYFNFHLVDHFFFGVGPGFTVSLSSSRTVGGVSGDGNSFFDLRLLSFVIGGTL